MAQRITPNRYRLHAMDCYKKAAALVDDAGEAVHLIERDVRAHAASFALNIVACYRNLASIADAQRRTYRQRFINNRLEQDRRFIQSDPRFDRHPRLRELFLNWSINNEAPAHSTSIQQAML